MPDIMMRDRYTPIPDKNVIGKSGISWNKKIETGNSNIPKDTTKWLVNTSKLICAASMIKALSAKTCFVDAWRRVIFSFICISPCKSYIKCII